MATEATTTKRLAEILLDESLDDFVVSRRSQTPARAWRLIARDIWEATSGQVDVTHETLRSWYPQQPESAAS